MTGRLLALAVAVSLAAPAAAQAGRHHPTHRRHRARVTHVAATAPAQGVKAPEGSFPVYGNDSVGDCGFAAAATWEWMTQNHPTSEGQLPQLLAEFHEAGGADASGISEASLASYWAGHGISGMRVSLTPEPSSQLEPLVQAHTALLAIVQLHTGEVIGSRTMVESTLHYLLVDGYSPTGPEVTTWGETSQLSWAQWSGMGAELYLPEVVR